MYSNRKDRFAHGLWTTHGNPTLPVSRDYNANHSPIYDFGLVGMQTDDTLVIGTDKFCEKEEAVVVDRGF
ncbi:hypothetical protein GQ602_001907 [Ophiocordyceps camponoti-floridani]|uniref:Uncharacterized protein n=1 Tax=Ophiocordyceps camponoti-floridani TaxID=2030778 RepID=A0A8H4Q9F5_9HYPO|nr:hypothetical protein GQ602_001907 [Ophiocordyceps camponoti-floridani]